MEVRELQFLLKLVALPAHKGKISELKPTSSTKIADTEKICRQLRDRSLVDCQEQVTLFKLSAVGKALLQLQVEDLPLTVTELKILQASSQNTITPSQVKITPAKTRDKLIDSCIERGLITVVATKIKQVWLTDKGKNYLLSEYMPRGHNSVLSLDLLNNYLGLLRENNTWSINSLRKISNQQITVSPNSKPTLSMTDEQVLQTIQDLDRSLNMGNYLPIFYLREKLQSFLTREELDMILYRLQREDKLELGSIVETSKYTSEQLKAGIPQNLGGCLFFLIVHQPLIKIENVFSN